MGEDRKETLGAPPTFPDPRMLRPLETELARAPSIPGSSLAIPAWWRVLLALNCTVAVLGLILLLVSLALSRVDLPKSIDGLGVGIMLLLLMLVGVPTGIILFIGTVVAYLASRAVRRRFRLITLTAAFAAMVLNLAAPLAAVMWASPR